MTNDATVSLWEATSDPGPTRILADADDTPEVLVVGAGIVGLTTALLLARAGRDVLVVEARHLGSGVTGYTTGKMTAAHGQRYASLKRAVGLERTRMYAEANQRAVDWVRDLIATEGIDCDWRERPAYTYTSSKAKARSLRSEAEATIEAGLHAHEVHGLPAPTEMIAGVRVDGSGELHGRRYALALARLAEAAGARIAEGIRVVKVREGDPCVVVTAERGEIRAGHVVIATHVPILDRGLYFARLQPERSYAIAARYSGDLPQGSFYDVGPPSRSVRTATGPGGEPVVIVGGEGHGTGRRHDTWKRYERLEAWAKEHVHATEVTHRWSSQDPMTPDKAPYVGPLRPGSTRLWTATGFGKWGLSGGTAAAHAIATRIGGGEDPYASLWNPSRARIATKPAQAGKLAAWNAETGAFLVGDRLRPTGRGGADALQPGEGRIVREGLKRTAAFRDGSGALHRHSSVCTHLGCEVHFNPAEQSWDCPCHGSRFDARDGTVLEGPAVRPLTRRDD